MTNFFSGEVTENQKIIVTGATGHLGNVLVRELINRGMDVTVLVFPEEKIKSIKGLKVNIIKGDIRNLDNVVEAFKGMDVVYHLAGIVTISPGKRELLNEVNIQGVRNVIEACMRVGVGRLVYVSSVHAFVEPEEGQILDEDSPIDPNKVNGDYAKSKAKATLEILRATENGLNAVIACPTGVIGPFDFKPSQMGQMYIDVIDRRLRAYIEGAYDFIDVRDVARGMILAAEKGQIGELYILSGGQITVSEIYKVIQKMTKSLLPSVRLPIWVAKIAGLLADVYYKIVRQRPVFTYYSIKTLENSPKISAIKAKTELGIKTMSLSKSVRDSIIWLAKNDYVDKRKIKLL